MCRSANKFYLSVFLFTCFLSVTTVSPAYADWEFQESGVTENLNDVCFVDEFHGWAVGDNSTIIATTDGGETWVRHDSPVYGLVLRKVQFVNHDVGFACGRSTYGTLIHTIDGGKTWKIMDFGPDSRTVWDLVFINKDEGWIAIEYYKKGSIGKILHTSDGGKTWETQLDYDRPIWAITFINDKIGWANGFWADSFCLTHVLHTTDGGKNWNKVGTIEPSPRRKLYTVKGETLWALPGHLSISKDSGFSWQKVIDKYENNVRDIYPISSTEAYLWILSGDFYLEYTYDLGSTTTRLFSVQGSEIWGTAIDVIKNKFVWIDGLEGKIIKYINDSTIVKEKHNNKPYIINLQQNYPNPFNNYTFIPYYLNKSCFVELIVFDISGKIVCTLVNENMTAEKHAATFDGSNLASGIYFYCFESKGYKKSGKMLLIK